MNNSENPLAVLGLTKDLVRQVPERALPEMVERHYRALMHTFHSDKGGDDTNAASLNEAIELFRQNPTVWRKVYLGKSSKLKKPVLPPIDQSVIVCPVLESVLQASLTGQYIDLVGLGARTVRVTRPLGGEVTEVITGLPSGRQRKVRRFIPPMGDVSNFRSITIDPGLGKLTIKTNKGESKEHRRVLIGTITPEACIHPTTGKFNMIHVHITGLYRDAVVADTKLLPPSDRLTAAWDGGYSPIVFKYALGLVSWGILSQYGTLFSVGFGEDQTLRFYNEGTICSVE